MQLLKILKEAFLLDGSFIEYSEISADAVFAEMRENPHVLKFVKEIALNARGKCVMLNAMKKHKQMECGLFPQRRPCHRKVGSFCL